MCDPDIVSPDSLFLTRFMTEVFPIAYEQKWKLNSVFLLIIVSQGTFLKERLCLPMQHYYHDLALLYLPLIGPQRSRDLNTGLWLVMAQYTVSVCLCLLELSSDWSSTNLLELWLAKATADWTARPLIGQNKSRDLNTDLSLVRAITYFQSETS